jgi:hypothetical protein
MHSEHMSGKHISATVFTRILLLDFDGVLHPAGGRPGQVVLPFCWLPELVAELEPNPASGSLSILPGSSNSTWSKSANFLRRWAGGCWRRWAPGRNQRAIQAFMRDQKHAVQNFLVIDDDPSQFGTDFARDLLICGPLTGLSNPETLARLREWLERSRTASGESESDVCPRNHECEPR